MMLGWKCPLEAMDRKDDTAQGLGSFHSFISYFPIEFYPPGNPAFSELKEFESWKKELSKCPSQVKSTLWKVHKY